jgi:hypothetical protein
LLSLGKPLRDPRRVDVVHTPSPTDQQFLKLWNIVRIAAALDVDPCELVRGLRP